MVHRLPQSDHEQIFDALQQILEVNSYIYAYHCIVCRDWQSIECWTINRMNKYYKNGRDLIECRIQLIHGMKGYCGHITHLGVVSDFEILIFCLFICFLVCLYLMLCWFCKRKMVQSFWRQITSCIFVKQLIFNISKAGVPKNIFDA